MYTGNHYAYLPYKCKTQTTKVTLSSSNIESYSKLKPVSQSESVITYGPYSNVEPFSFDEMTVHYENNNPFLIVTKLERIVELSMWGNIAIEETLDVQHVGAKLKGSFSRYEFQKENSGVSAVKMFKSVLPAAGNVPYYIHIYFRNKAVIKIILNTDDIQQNNFVLLFLFFSFRRLLSRRHRKHFYLRVTFLRRLS